MSTRDSIATLLDDVETFLERFVAYPSEDARVAHVLWIAHTWLMDRWDSTPRIAFLSPEPGSGKSRALEVTEPLVPRPVHAVNVTPAYLFRKVSDADGSPTILYDEIDTVFGPKAKDNEEVRGMLNAGHRKGAFAGRCVVKGQTVVTEELPAYCAVALAGLHDLPDTIATRSVIVRMRRRGPGECIEPWRLRDQREPAAALAVRLEAWSRTVPTIIDWPAMPTGIEDRNADVWEALLAVAELAGEGWTQRAHVAALALVTDTRNKSESLGVLLLRDLRLVFDDAEKLATGTLLEQLHAIDTSPWGDLRGKPLDSRGLARLLKNYDVGPAKIRLDSGTVQGYRAADLLDPWSRYLPPSPQKSGTSRTTEHLSVNPPESVPDTPSNVPEHQPNVPDEIALFERDVPDVLHVPDFWRDDASGEKDTQRESCCTACRLPLATALADLGETTHPTCDAAVGA